ncbi:MAG TPA: amino acid adenylation domain-containing protein [Candidatus Deferrimicrobium sp.]|nr:amino acid adenylation domain-containing protein [Candidatus Deferrimicrobium sp.]
MTKEKSFQCILNESLSKFNDNIAIEYGNRFITYSELDRQSNTIADFIMAKGIKNQTFIGFLIDDRLEVIFTAIGILKAGCVIVPLYSSYPNGRIEMMINATEIGYIFIDAINGLRFGEGGIQLQSSCIFFPLAQFFSTGDYLKSNSRTDIQFSPEDQLYVHFTSGTTGIPKAVVGKNKSLLHFINWEIETFGVTDSYRAAQFTIPGFDPFLRDVFVPLFSGGVVCIPGTEAILVNPEKLVQWVDQHKISIIHCVSSLFRLLSVDYLTPRHFEALKFILLAGEKVTPSDLVHWYNVFGNRIQLVNCYGPTETTQSKVYYLIQPSDVNRDTIPIGKPMKGCRVIILDENMKVCAPLDVGEIYIRTPFRSCGYKNDPELTKKKFIKNPFNDDPDDLLYKSGDLGRFLLDGNLEILGRVDRQVKIRGNRIELEDIESILLKHTTVKEAVVIKQEFSIENQYLFACIVLCDSIGDNDGQMVEAIRQYLSEHLPGKTIPSKIKIVKRIPRKVTGKVDYAKIAELDRISEENLIKPRNTVEEKLAAIWSKLLGGLIPGITENFFYLGGNSLSVMSLIASIHREFDVRISLEVIFKNVTIEKQAQLIREAVKDKFISIEPTDRKEYYALSSAQKRIYISHHQLGKDNASYNMPSFTILEGRLDIEKLETGFRKLIKRHESLRTSFLMEQYEPVQRIHDDVPLSIVYFETGEEKSQEIIENFRRPFQLDHPPLFRVGLIKTSETAHILIIDMHHIISDGASMSILLKEFLALYEEKELPPLNLQYKDYAEWQNKLLQADEMNRQEKYWLKKFEDKIPELEILTDQDPSELRSFGGDAIDFILDAEQTSRLHWLTKETGTTLYIVLLAAYAILISKYTGQEDFILGSTVAGRRHADLENIIGIFVNMLPIRIYPEPEKIFRNFLEEVRENVLQAFENQDYPFDEMIKKLGVQRKKNRNPLFDTQFTFQTIAEGYSKDSQLKIKPYKNLIKTMKFHLSLNAMETGEIITMTFLYITDIFRRETIEKMAEHYIEILSRITEDNIVKIGDIGISHKFLKGESDVSREEYVAFEF